MKNVSTWEGWLIGFIVGATSPTSLVGSLSDWRFWVYIIIVTILVQLIYGKIKGWLANRNT